MLANNLNYLHVAINPISFKFIPGGLLATNLDYVLATNLYPGVMSLWTALAFKAPRLCCQVRTHGRPRLIPIFKYQPCHAGMSSASAPDVRLPGPRYAGRNMPTESTHTTCAKSELKLLHWQLQRFFTTLRLGKGLRVRAEDGSVDGVFRSWRYYGKKSKKRRKARVEEDPDESLTLVGEDMIRVVPEVGQYLRHKREKNWYCVVDQSAQKTILHGVHELVQKSSDDTESEEGNNDEVNEEATATATEEGINDTEDKEVSDTC